MKTLASVVSVSLLLLSAGSAVRAGDTPRLSFLQPGDDYVLRFAGKSPFEQTEGIPFDLEHNKSPNTARITSASVTYSINVFTVVELCDDSWVLVEHPKSIKDAFKWNFKRFAMAALNPDTINTLQVTEEGKAKLEKLRTQAAIQIETETTWVNLAHVVAIAKPPKEPQDYKLTTRVKASD